MITDVEILNLKNRLSSGVEEGPFLYDPIMCSFIQSSLAHFIYLRRYRKDVNELTDKEIPFNPNYIRYHFMDNVVSNKASLSLESFSHYEFSPGLTDMDMGRINHSINNLIEDTIIRDIAFSFVNKIQESGEAINRIRVLKKTKPSKVLGLLYFVFMDIYLDVLDDYINKAIVDSSINCFWCRSLNTAILSLCVRCSLSPGISSSYAIPRSISFQ